MNLLFSLYCALVCIVLLRMYQALACCSFHQLVLSKGVIAWWQAVLLWAFCPNQSRFSTCLLQVSEKMLSWSRTCKWSTHSVHPYVRNISRPVETCREHVQSQTTSAAFNFKAKEDKGLYSLPSPLKHPVVHRNDPKGKSVMGI